MRIGIDVGGTNTDAVLMDGDRVVVGIKSSTTEDVTSGIVGALAELDRQHPFDPADIDAVMIGTTHFINALVEARRLAPTAAVRLALPATASLPPFVDWPEELVAAVRGTGYLAHGGHEFDGRVIAPLDHDELKRHAADIAARGLRSVAISSVFAPVNSEFEVEAAAVLAAELGPDVAISLSHEIGRIGLLERENATIINASLRELADQIVGGLERAVRGHGITAPLYLSQNDGTLMGVDFARRYPVATFASGPTNSMRGAALLSGLGTCAVVDIGGTTSDVGVLAGGFPREATAEISVAGVRTNFRMPDVLSIGIGGGSLVRGDGDLVGPDSVGYELGRRALVFGGDTLTTTDIAVAAGMVDVGDPACVAHLSPQLVRRALDTIAMRVADVVERMRTSSAPLPVVAVGGGSILLPESLEGLGRVHRPENFAVANAVGAAIAQVSGELDRVYSVSEGSRQQALDDARQEAVERAVAAGASPSTVEIVDFDELPIPYLPGNAIRIRAKAVGDLDLDTRKAAHV
ncbi:hydantoinase/oxoprolinase N-terminal domain-containing protein [Clavibacter nebraskensis]|uniref:Hydantoinase/oxoprolinase family protein n=2 Tax=Clavibacter nebraskensis TaxID=31963 RepID=A0A399QHP4_9MICO|nr:hydantoinase/oxoprolinase family protein [Clavibacter nebraskensis]KXU19880.1 hydantoinase subunit beta [Clavibacter nebraskensis]OAH18429.1 hydantoinase subunit beta [Clavibacter nebraskensis]QGV67485.1 hydantoinase/oxoprolinase family protein [Clavibacter nebraskensis]QGV70284.1 hydantoinase/oxoprolinase family protein [Clavibacter nebraskensis]QGV73075.1 hydantoinase/oxoprolinase family protein [Clavibacter nebraskensis]